MKDGNSGGYSNIYPEDEVWYVSSDGNVCGHYSAKQIIQMTTGRTPQFKVTDQVSTDPEGEYWLTVQDLVNMKPGLGIDPNMLRTHGQRLIPKVRTPLWKRATTWWVLIAAGIAIVAMIIQT